MTPEGMKAMLERGHRDVRITEGTHAGLVTTVGLYYPTESFCRVVIPGFGLCNYYVHSLEPAYPQVEVDLFAPPSLVAADPAQRPVNAYTTILGVVAWREADRPNRRIHISLIDDSTDSVWIWATTLSPLRDREIRFTKHLQAAEVPAILGGLMESRDDRPTHPSGLDVLMQEVG